MAEGGGEEDLANPFSFKTYVKKKTKQEDDPDVNSDDIFAIPVAASSSRKKEKQSLVVADDDDEASQATKSKKKGNPFSFKKFLGQSGSRENNRSQGKNTPADLTHNGSALAGGIGPSPVLGRRSPGGAMPGQAPSFLQHAGGPPDFASDLPDFIQNHYSEGAASAGHERPQLPDFALQTGGQQSHHAGGGRQAEAASLFASEDQDVGLADTTFSDEEDGAGGPRGRQLSLPDFLVDSAVSGPQGRGEQDGGEGAGAREEGVGARSRLPELPSLADSMEGGRSGEVRVAPDSSIVMQLREENHQLQVRIAQMQQRSRDEETRVPGLEKEIKRLKKKEAEETAVMESAVMQVEENLVTTTTRAVQAETMVTKLKQEVKTLQGQVKMLTAENESLKSGDRGLSDIRERTKYASDQLASAAVTAEKNLRELMGGVDKLKLLGQVLSSLEKVTEAEGSPSP